MRYEVRFETANQVKEEYDKLEYALHTARCLCNWKLPCNVVDTETGEVIPLNGETVPSNA